jgi:hypothetical protein
VETNEYGEDGGKEPHVFVVGSENSEPLIPEILSRSALEGEASSKYR